MLSPAELPLRVVGDQAFFDYLGPQDEPWVGALVQEMVRFEGQPRQRLRERLAEPLPFATPHVKRRAVTRVLLRLWRAPRPAGVNPRLAREVVFTAAGLTGAARERVLDESAGVFGVSRAALEEALFADLPGQRRVYAPQPLPTAAEVVRRTNLAITQGVLMRASAVVLRVSGIARPIVRLAKLRGLLCTVSPGTAEQQAALEISGPYALFRHTLLYGRALAELLPHLLWCGRFTLTARAALHGRLCEVTLDNLAPIVPATPPRPFDSKLEARFAADISRLALDWDLVREPEPIPAAGTLIFPDFQLRHRLHPRRSAFIELVGFWTPAYLAEKFARLRAAGVRNLVLCLDEQRVCADADLPPGLPVVRYRRRVDAAAVLKAVEALTSSAPATPGCSPTGP